MSKDLRLVWLQAAVGSFCQTAGWWYTSKPVQKLFWGTAQIKILEWFFFKSAFKVLKNLWQGMKKTWTTNLSFSREETCTNTDVKRAKTAESYQPVGGFHLHFIKPCQHCRSMLFFLIIALKLEVLSLLAAILCQIRSLVLFWVRVRVRKG